MTRFGRITMAAALCLVLVLMLFSCAKPTNKGSADTKTTADEQAKEQDAGKSKETDAEEVYGLGDFAFHEGISVSIDGIEAPKKEHIFDKPAPGMRFVILRISVQNEMSETVDCPSRNNFSIVVDDKSYHPDIKSIYQPDGDKYGGDPLESGKRHQFAPLFQIPEGAKEYEVRYAPGLGDAKLFFRFSD